MKFFKIVNENGRPKFIEFKGLLKNGKLIGFKRISRTHPNENTSINLEPSFSPHNEVLFELPELESTDTENFLIIASFKYLGSGNNKNTKDE